MFLTVAAFVFFTTCCPLEPARFFFVAVALRWALVRDRALLSGKHRSGFFLSLEVLVAPFL